jgi:CubicO group peptidase (beta-lactamase class C family)
MKWFCVFEDGVLVRAHRGATLVPWWSFTKTILAAAALRLVELGQLSLEEPLHGQSCCLRQLLQHRAGLPDYGELAAYQQAVERGDEPWPVETLLDRVDSQRQRYEPDKGWAYSNVGYWMVRRLIEQCCDEPLGSALNRLVCQPLDVANVRLAEIPSDLYGVEMGEAGPYHPGWVYHGLLVGPLASTALLLQRLMLGQLLSSPTLEMMARGFPLPTYAEPPWPAPAYGLGLMVSATTSGTHGHSGAGPGSQIAVYGRMVGNLHRAVAVWMPTSTIPSGVHRAADQSAVELLMQP